MDSKSLWYMQSKAGTAEGPYSDQQILKMAMEGSLSRTAKVRHTQRTKNEWILATAVPGLGSIVLNNTSPVAEVSPQKGPSSNPTPAPAPQRSKPSETSGLGLGVPRWSAANPILSRNDSLSHDYWDSMSTAAAEDQVIESLSKTAAAQTESDNSTRSRKILKRQLYDLVVAGTLIVLLIAILISGGLFLAGSLMLGYSDEELEAIAKRATPAGLGWNDELERSSQVVAGAPGILPHPELSANRKSNDSDSSEEPEEQMLATDLDFSSLSGRYDIGEKGRAKQELVSIEVKRITARKRGEDLHELDAQLLEDFGKHGFVSAEMTIEPKAGGTGKQSLVCSITNIVQTIPEVDDCGTALGRDSFDQLLKRGKNGDIVIVLSKDDLQNIAKAKDAIRRELSTKMPSEILDPQETEKLLDALKLAKSK
ncbi:MAG: hypothetical protein ACK6DC_13580 [Planctomycetota bacterium]